MELDNAVRTGTILMEIGDVLDEENRKTIKATGMPGSLLNIPDGCDESLKELAMASMVDALADKTWAKLSSSVMLAVISQTDRGKRRKLLLLLSAILVDWIATSDQQPSKTGE